jgi:AraC family transcriptional activator of pobA
MKKEKIIPKNESLEEFEGRNLLVRNNMSEEKSFRFLNSADCLSGTPILYRRRNFYKVSLLEGKYVVHYGDESISVSGVSLSFFSPFVPYTVDVIEEQENSGYFIFTETFYDTYFKEKLQFFPLFQQNKKPIFQLSASQAKEVKGLFAKIERYNASDYNLKYDLIRNTINELMHYGNNLQPAYQRSNQLSSKQRLVTIFNELLDRQYPTDDEQSQNIRSVRFFADSLNVHVNYLNRVLKDLTGKSTSDLLYERLLKESIILLKHTNSSISEIAYNLGFKDTSHFNHFFKKHSNHTPSFYRS